MEGRGKQVGLSNEDGKAIAGGDGFDREASAGNPRRPDKDHLQWTAFELRGRGENRRVDLASVGVALYRDIQGRERLLGRVLYVRGEQDAAGTGPEGRGGLHETFEYSEEVVALQKFEHRGGLTAGHDEAVDTGEFFRDADKRRRRSECGERSGMGFVCPLEGEHADFE